MTVTLEQLQGLVIEIPESFDIVPVVQIAGTFRTEYLDDRAELSTAKKSLLELLIAAHFTVLAVEKGGLVRSVMGDAAETYREIHARQNGFYSTRFGQQAIALDSSGVLASVSTGMQRAEFQVV